VEADMHWLPLTFLLLFGALTSVWDIKKGKIQNKNILLAIVFALVVNLSLDAKYVADLWINALVALGAGFAFWRFGLWTAGDAKLFFAYALIVPLEAYRYGYVPYFPSFVVLINSLVAALMFLSFKLVGITDLKEKIGALKRSLSPREVGKMSLYFFGVIWAIGAIFRLVGIPLNFSAGMLLAVGAMFLLNARLGRLMFPLSAALSIARVALEFSSLLTLSFWVQFFFLLFVFVLLLGFITNLGRFMFSRNVRLSELGEGMVSAETVFSGKGRYEKSRAGIAAEDCLVTRTHTGITRAQIEKLRELQKKGMLSFDSLEIQQMLPFAPVLFLGVLLTLFFSGSIIDFAKIAYLCPHSGSASGIPGFSDMVASACKITYY